MKRVFIVIFTFFLFINCAKELNYVSQTNYSAVSFDSLKFIVVSDLHVYDTVLGYDTKEFEDYLNNDRKLLIQSEEILDEFINSIDTVDFDFIIIPGDMTKDGEYINHELVKKYFDKFVKKGIPVFVIPGNHDINNPDAYKFTKKGKIPVKSINPDEFMELYNNYGYRNAIYRDRHSLSYITEFNNTWIFALDACKYKMNENEPIISGKFSNETLEWMKEKLELANIQKKSIIVFMHHGILEHFKGQKKYYPEYVLDDYKKVSKLLASYNVKYVFTGHFHANDITLKEYNINGKKKILYDIETGSLITYPNPYRIVILKNDKYDIETRYINQIKSMPNNFSEYSYDFIYSGLTQIVYGKLREFKINARDAEKISGRIANTIIEHYKGNERYDKDILKFNNISLLSKIIIHFQKGMIEGMNRDLPPED